MNDWRSWVVLLVPLLGAVLMVVVAICALTRGAMKRIARANDRPRLPRAVIRRKR